MGKSFYVTVDNPTFVCPETASNTSADQLQSVYLSPLDLQAPIYMYSLYFYRRHDSKQGSETVFDVLKEALCKVLVLYYPAAGRLKQNAETQKSEIECNNRGVLLVKATTDARIDELGDSNTTDPQLERFVYKLRPTPDSPLIATQVTLCACGGFIIGFGCRHELFDANSAMQFLSAWAAVARKVSLSDLPIPSHNRELLKPNPADLSVSQQAASTLLQKFEGIALWKKPDENKSWEGTVADFPTIGANAHYITRIFKLTKETLVHLKEQAMEDGEIMKCSTFDVVTAHAWRARVLALEMDRSEKLILRFAVDGRARMEPPLPPTFIGNAFIMASHSCTVGDIVDSPLSSVVKRVQQAKADVGNSYIRETINGLAATRIKALPSFRQTTVVSDWTRFPFHLLDFGWGGSSFATHVAMPLLDVIFLIGVNGSVEKEELHLKLGLLPNYMQKFEHYLFQIQPQANT